MGNGGSVEGVERLGGMGVDAMEGEFVEGAEGAAFVEGAKAKGSGADEAWRMAC